MTGWHEKLLAYAGACRDARPVVSRETLRAEEEHRCRIIGGSLISWFEEELDDILSQRAVLQRIHAYEPDPFLVIVTEMAGMVAVREILEDTSEVALLLPEEWEAGPLARDEDDFARRINYWSYFRPLTPAKFAEAGVEGLTLECARLHTVGHLWGRQAGMETLHLWEWTGDSLELIAPGYEERVF